MAAGLRLAALLFLLGLATSRVGLLLHELGGHGGAAAAAGCRVTELRLFLFGGGWIGYDCPPLAPAPGLAIDLGGIALELTLGALAIGWARRRAGALPLAATLAGWLFVLHGLFYLVTGVHYGMGDGRRLHGLLGAARGPLVAVGSVALAAGSFAAATALVHRLAAWLPASGASARTATLAAAALVAAAGHGVLMRAEQAWRADPVYAATFEPEHERAVAEHMRTFEQERPRTSTELATRRRVLVERHAPFPLTPLLAASMTIAAFAGIVRVARRPPAPAGAPPLPAAALACAAALAAVVLADHLW